MQITEGVWQVDGLRASNVFVLAANNGVVLVDAGVPGSASTVLAFLAQIGYGPDDVRAILLTHTHIDHIGSLPALREATNVPIYVPPGEAGVIEGRQPVPRPAGPHGPVFAFISNALRPKPLAVHGHLRSGDRAPHAQHWRVVGTPGHTPDHVSLYQHEQQLLITGDALANMGKLSGSPSFFTSNMPQAQRSLALLAGLPLRSAAFGHGDPIVDDPALSDHIAALARKGRH